MAFHAPAPTRVSASDFKSPKAVDTGRHRDLRTVNPNRLDPPDLIDMPSSTQAVNGVPGEIRMVEANRRDSAAEG
jgi:hypothetical protein